MRLGTVLSLASLAACGDLVEEQRACTLVGCVDGFQVTALAPSSLPAGSYEIQATLDGTLVTCTHPTVAPAAQTSPACNAANVRSTVVIHNASSSTSEANAFAIEIIDTPAVVQLRVFHEGEPIGESRYEPSYRVTMPNGPECEPTCASAPGQVLPLAFD